MTAIRFGLLATAAFSAMAVNPALAQGMTGDDAAALRAELAALRGQVAALEARVAAAEQAPTPAPVAVVAPAKPATPETEVNWRGAPEMSRSDGWSFKPRGRIHLDAGTVDAPDSIRDSGLGFANRFRRVRLGVEGSVPGGFGYRMEADFARGGAEITDAFLTYEAGKVEFTVGQHNDLRSLDEETSSNDATFIERAAFTDAFNYRRRVGVSVKSTLGDFFVQGGVFTDNISSLQDDENSSVGVSGRAVWAPKVAETQLHFGIAANWRDQGNGLGQSTTRYRQRPLVAFTDTRLISTPQLRVIGERELGFEIAAMRGRWHLAGEARWLKANLAGPIADPTFFGGYAEVGVFLTDDKRGYRDGHWRSVRVRNPISKGGLGAVQFNLRWDHLDLSDRAIVGGQQDAYQASLIWTPVDYVRFMLNYARIDYTDAVVPAGARRDYAVDVVGTRAQVAF